MRLLGSLPFVLAGASAIAASASRAPAGDTSRAVGYTSRPMAMQADTVREYRGSYATGFEISWFRPCEAERGDDTWWVTLTNDALRQRDSLAKTLTGQPRAVFVRWRGTISPKMPAGAGHMGGGSRYMLVTEILEMKPVDEAGCAKA